MIATSDNFRLFGRIKVGLRLRKFLECGRRNYHTYVLWTKLHLGGRSVLVKTTREQFY